MGRGGGGGGEDSGKPFSHTLLCCCIVSVVGFGQEKVGGRGCGWLESFYSHWLSELENFDLEGWH